MTHKHEWKEGYYGWECDCGAFVAYGSEPWVDEEDEDLYEYRTCEICGGEFWPGGTSCTCMYLCESMASS